MRKSKIIKSEAGPNITVQIINARLIRIAPLIPEVEEYLEEKLIGLHFDSGLSVSQGCQFKTDKQVYKVQEVKKMPSKYTQYGIGYYLYLHHLNKASRFLMPFLGHNKVYFRWETDFCNCFIGTEEEGDTGHLYLLYRFSGSKDFSKFEEKMQEHPLFEGICDVDQFHAMYKFKIPENVKEDVKLIKSGQYSKVSKEGKIRILHFHSITRDSPIGDILYKGEKKKRKLEEDLEITIDKDAELHDPFYDYQELYLNKYVLEDIPTFKKQ